MRGTISIRRPGRPLFVNPTMTAHRATIPYSIPDKSNTIIASQRIIAAVRNMGPFLVIERYLFITFAVRGLLKLPNRKKRISLLLLMNFFVNGR
jgi:hypothetical protein